MSTANKPPNTDQPPPKHDVCDKKQCSKPAQAADDDIDIDLKDPAVNDAASKIQSAFRKHQDHKHDRPNS